MTESYSLCLMANKFLPEPGVIPRVWILSKYVSLTLKRHGATSFPAHCKADLVTSLVRAHHVAVLGLYMSMCHVATHVQRFPAGV